MGLTIIQGTCPPPLVLSDPDSSNVITRIPSVWKLALAMSGAILALSQLSAVLSEQSCASLQRLGVMKA